MSDLDRFVLDRVHLLALANRTDVVLHVDEGSCRLQVGDESLALRLDPRALPVRTAALDVICAAQSLRAACGGEHATAFAELLRATRPEGRAVVAEQDAAGTFGAEHQAAKQAGWVASPMEAIPVQAPHPVRLFVAFKPAADKNVASERGHGTH